MHFPIHTGHSFYLMSEPTFYPDLSIYTKQHELLRELSCKSDCVIVGRCADHILREQKPVRIFCLCGYGEENQTLHGAPSEGRESNRCADDETYYGDRPQPCKSITLSSVSRNGVREKTTTFS